MKEYCLNNFFKVLYFKHFPIKYITQSKEKDKLKNSCVKDLIKNYKNEEFDGLYVAFTNDMIIKRLEYIEGVKVLKILWSKNVDIDGLKKYLVGQYTYCNKCEEKCKLRDHIMKNSENKKCYFIIFWKCKQGVIFK